MKENNSFLRLLILAALYAEQLPISQGDLVNKIADFLNMSKEDRQREHSNGDKVFYKRIASEEQYLKKAGLEVFLSAGHQITKKGESFLKNKWITRQSLRFITDKI